jgi:hypothetical protein
VSPRQLLTRHFEPPFRPRFALQQAPAATFLRTTLPGPIFPSLKASLLSSAGFGLHAGLAMPLSDVVKMTPFAETSSTFARTTEIRPISQNTSSRVILRRDDNKTLPSPTNNTVFFASAGTLFKPPYQGLLRALPLDPRPGLGEKDEPRRHPEGMGRKNGAIASVFLPHGDDVYPSWAALLSAASSFGVLAIFFCRQSLLLRSAMPSCPKLASTLCLQR